VIGLTSSQTAANILASAGIIAHNTARFLGHTEDSREALLGADDPSAEVRAQGPPVFVAGLDQG
jgi:hypothetical protein